MKRPKTPSSEDLFVADLARSGITAADAKRLKLRLLDSKATARLGVRGAPVAYRIPYLDPAGRDTGYFRLRLLTGLMHPKAARYWQPDGSLPQLFFPPAKGIDLPALLKDPTIPLRITEGEKKAYRASREEMTTLGVGGVWNWRSRRAGTLSLAIKDLDLIEWSGREVLFIFDSDVATNPRVQEAMRAFGREVLARGGRPKSVKLPPGEGGVKVGLDDFLEAQGSKGRASLSMLEKEAEPLLGTLPDELWRLNSELAVVQTTGLVWQFATRRYLNPLEIKNLYGNRIVNVPTERGSRPVSVEKEWLRWKLRREIPRVVFEPAEPPGFTSAGDVNLWRGWGVEAKPGTVKPWDDLLSYLFDGDDAARGWFEDWCAYPLQHPGTKLYSAVVLFSLDQGVGKSLVGETLKKIYGSAGVTLNQEQLGSPFNSWAAQKLFALADEVTGSDKRRDADRFKSLITQETVTVNEKYQPQYTLKDCLNYLFTTNHPDALFLEGRDRRFFVHQIHLPKQADAFYAAYHRWLNDEEGAEHLLHHLKKRRVERFNPRGAAPHTEAKQLMRDLSRSDLDIFAEQLRDDPDSALRLDGQPVAASDLMTLAEILAYADPSGLRRTTGIALSKALARAELRQTPQIRLATGPTKLWIVRNRARWLRASYAELKAEREKGAVKLTALEGGRKF